MIGDKLQLKAGSTLDWQGSVIVIGNEKKQATLQIDGGFKVAGNVVIVGEAKDSAEFKVSEHAQLASGQRSGAGRARASGAAHHRRGPPFFAAGLRPVISGLPPRIERLAARGRPRARDTVYKHVTGREARLGYSSG